MLQEAHLKPATLLREGDSQLMVIGACSGVMGMPGASNYLEFSCKLFDAPEEIDNMARRNFERGLELGQALRDAGIVAVYMAADMADTMAPFKPRGDGSVYPALHQGNGGETERDGNVCHVTYRW